MFKKATRSQVKLRMALCGTSGSGKTYAALLIAKGIGGPIAMIDTENGSGSLYEYICDYDVADIRPPFAVDKYIASIKEAERAGYNVLIIDSLSHAWAGQGGLLEEVDRIAAASRSKNTYTAWRDITPLHNKLVDTILQCDMHVIVTMRTKTAYDLAKDDKGKLTPVKMGMAPIQRDGLEYEFTLVLDLENAEHTAIAGKDRTGLFDKKVFVPSEVTGKMLFDWLNQGAPLPSTEKQLRIIWDKARQSGLSGEDVKQIIGYKFGLTSSSELSFDQAQNLRHNLETYWDEYLQSKTLINNQDDDKVLEESIGV